MLTAHSLCCCATTNEWEKLSRRRTSACRIFSFASSLSALGNSMSILIYASQPQKQKHTRTRTCIHYLQRYKRSTQWGCEHKTVLNVSRTFRTPCSDGTPWSGMPSSFNVMTVPGRVTFLEWKWTYQTTEMVNANKKSQH